MIKKEDSFKQPLEVSNSLHWSICTNLENLSLWYYFLQIDMLANTRKIKNIFVQFIKQLNREKSRNRNQEKLLYFAKIQSKRDIYINKKININKIKDKCRFLLLFFYGSSVTKHLKLKERNSKHKTSNNWWVKLYKQKNNSKWTKHNP